MKAQLLHAPVPVATHPLVLTDVPPLSPPPEHILVRVSVCGVCHTDLHVVEGELPNPKLPLIPGHEIVGAVDDIGQGVTRFAVGKRVGIPWLHQTDGSCEYCLRGQENLCESAQFTGYTADGGYAEYTLVHQDFAVPIPERFSDVEAAPLLCAGIVGYRSLRMADLQLGERLGLFGFGGSAHLCIQVARYWGCDVYVFTRSDEHQRHTLKLGAAWVGQAQDSPPKLLDRAIIFAPAGWIVPLALSYLRKAGTLCINAIHTNPVPEMPYRLLWGERTIRTVANATRRDAEAFLSLAAEIGIRTDTVTLGLDDANRALQMLKSGEIIGAAVLQVS